MTENDIAYFAGLFDGEGSVYFKKTKQVKHNRPGKPIHNVTVIRMEIAMTDKDTIKWCYDTFKCGHWGERKVKEGYKRQWRWRVAHRDALNVAIAIWPYVKTKLHKIEQIIDHYEGHDGLPKNVVDLEEYRLTRRFNWNLHGL
tara:strand:- start:123 stop:551 length:429 start_codon:yes stop_codon:yes gene_type:complete